MHPLDTFVEYQDGGVYQLFYRWMENKFVWEFSGVQNLVTIKLIFLSSQAIQINKNINDNFTIIFSINYKAKF